MMPDVGKDFPGALNGMGMLAGPPSAPAATTAGSAQQNVPLLERGNAFMQQSQQQQVQLQQGPQPGQQQQQQQMEGEGQQMQQMQGEDGPRALTAIFRPDDAGEWKEKLRMSHEASEAARLEREAAAAAGAGNSGWAAGEEGKEEVEEEEEEASVNEEGAKVWKPKRTLRK